MRGRRTAMVLVALIAAAACGGDDDLPGDADNAAQEVAPDGLPDDSSDVGADEGGEGGGDGVVGGAPDDEVQQLLDGLDFGDGGARVTIGDTTYEFALGGNSSIGSTTYVGICQQLFGMMAGSGYDTGGRAVTVDFEIPPVDWESYEDGRFSTSSPRLVVEDAENDVAWAADQSLVELYPETAGLSQIDEWVTDGTRASGTATFIELEPWSAPVEGASPVEGNFELGCAED